MSTHNIDQLRMQLRAGCDRIPVDKAKDWNWNQATAYKDAVFACRKIANKAKVTENELQAAINRLAAFW